MKIIFIFISAFVLIFNPIQSSYLRATLTTDSHNKSFLKNKVKVTSEMTFSSSNKEGTPDETAKVFESIISAKPIKIKSTLV